MSTAVPSSSSAHLDPTTDREDHALPEHLNNPTCIKHLVDKANLLMKPHLNHDRMPVSEIGKAIAAIIKVTHLVSRGDKVEKKNTAYYNRLLNQVVQGKRVIATLVDNVDGVPGINSEFARVIGIPLNPFPTTTPATTRHTDRFGKNRSGNVRRY